MVETRRLCGALGAEVSGVDLSKRWDDDTARSIVDAFHEHLVLVFRGQSLDPRLLRLRSPRLFGEPHEHPLRTRASVDGFPEVLIIETRPGRMGARNDYWHSDISHQERPPSASILHALAVPGRSRRHHVLQHVPGAAENALTRDAAPARRHAGRAQRRSDDAPGTTGAGNRCAPRRLGAAAPGSSGAAHLHPGTGCRALFVNPHFTESFAGMTKEESAPMLDYLTEHSTRPENVYRHRWAVGDVGDLGQPLHHALRGARLRRHRPAQAPPAPPRAGELPV